MKNRFWFGILSAVREKRTVQRGELVGVKGIVDAFPIALCAPTRQLAMLTCEELAKQFFPSSKGYTEQRVMTLEERDAIDFVSNLLQHEGVTAAELRTLADQFEGK